MPTTPVVYIDVVWLVNFVMDAMLLWTTGWILKRKMKFVRVVLGGLTGACYSLLLFFPTLSLLTTWPGKALVSVAMVFIALPRKGMLDLARVVVVFYFVSFVFAGAAVALGFAIPGQSLGKAIQTGSHGLVFATSGETLALMVAVPLCVFGLQRLMSKLRRVQHRENWLCRVTASFDGTTIHFTGLLDSGNQLYDPVSRRPVSFVDLDVLLPVLPEAVQAHVAAGHDMLSAVATLTGSKSFTLVPFQGASGRGLTIALRPDHILVEQANRTWPVVGAHLFAVYPGKLSSDDAFSAILHMDMMNGDDEVEGISDAKGPQYEAQNSPAAAFHSHPHETPR
ncbi:sigma-E processing peptidase SpoIIGA [Alicyclobacillus dauci]|uniref:Sigma-E processing peptidase SpoIIGA n=1 Tax=Alicyclobacillus dauci TaxID=1475485 RepID=A0ABY6Z0N2_9BACL|nr:sigma-E processing peptidase SpoIIGA [Alicyclobacillus dauci]WAH35525.1 sigma-E processing peptidase SpoIIGA [Alicyclobacillus dauci]